MGEDTRRTTRQIILARRAKFVAAAFAGLSAARCGGDTTEPQPCLSVALDGGKDTGTPQPCLSPRYEPDAEAPDAGDAGDAADAADAADGD
jgi:hypothetical protein